MNVNEQKQIRYSRQIVAFRDIFRSCFPQASLQRLLVFGCGNGLEAAFAQQILNCQVCGVDVDQQFHPWAAERANLCNYDGRRLNFPDGFFDALYSFHVLEHVENVAESVAEIRRVVKPGGFVYIGVPNKSRLVGYLGMNDKSLFRKIKQNLKDIIKRVQGQWENELGAHAGFKEDELIRLLSPFFTQVFPVSSNYYAAKWQKHQKWLRLIEKISLDRLLFPAVYVVAAD
ncbi:MAG: class I SAM-dependent methyltransferase [Calditrichaeota bacterium]|nr:MAG: class I SAM-dependent methyltransferase [Calditrichota bacterium]